jgi:succinate dehydrogenase / fumarate reductase flavoprotein subunit
MMHELVGIVRQEDEMIRAVNAIEILRRKTEQVGVVGNREYNPAWHTALDLPNLLTVSEAVARAGIERKESRGAHFREDFPEKDPEYGAFNLVVRKGSGGDMEVVRRPREDMPAELQQIIEENQ